MDNVELKKKVTLKRKGESPTPTTLSQSKKTKWWLWFLPIIIIVAVVMIVKFYPSGNDNASIAENESTPAEQTLITNDAAISVAQTVSPENSQSNNDQSQASTTPSERNQSISSDNPSKISSKTKANNESIVTSTTKNTQEPANSVQTVSGVDGKAWEVIRGRFGNGEDRKQNLGAEYESIQRRVNEIYESGQIQ